MEQISHKYVCVAYELFVDNEKGNRELVEKAPVEHPYQFISGMGLALDSFEDKILELSEGDKFDFTLAQDEAYGPYEEERVLEFSKQQFSVNGRFDKNVVYPGAVLPLVNGDGNRFDALVLEVKEDTVVIDLNAMFAGKDLHFRGQVVTLREATDEEIKGVINMLSGEGCGCGCDDCGGGCGGHGHDEGEGCCGGGQGHGHGEGEGCCGGHGHKHGEGEGCCGGHGHKHGEGKGCCGGHD